MEISTVTCPDILEPLASALNSLNEVSRSEDA